MEPVNHHPSMFIKRNAYGGSLFAARKQRVVHNEFVPLPFNRICIDHAEERRKHKLRNILTVVIGKQFNAPTGAVLVNKNVCEPCTGSVVYNLMDSRLEPHGGG